MAEIKGTAGVDSPLEDLVRTRMTVREIELLPGQIELSEAQEQSFAAALGGAMLGAFLRKDGRELVLDWRAIGDGKESTIEAHRMVSQVSTTGRIGLPVAASHASIKVGAIDGMLREAGAGFLAGREIEDLLPKALEQAEVASVGDAAKVSASRAGGWLVGTHESADPDALSVPSRRRQKVRGAFTAFHAQTRPEPPQTERSQEAEAAGVRSQSRKAGAYGDLAEKAYKDPARRAAIMAAGSTGSALSPTRAIKTKWSGKKPSPDRSR